MKKLELSYLPYEFKLKKTFATSGISFNSRKGFIVSLTSENGKSGVGDCAPFPEFSSETYEEAELALSKSELHVKIDKLDPLNSIEESLKPLHHFPALRHGVEQALLSLVCSEMNMHLSELLSVNPKDIVKVNAVLGMVSTEEALDEVKSFLAKGYSTVKVKSGRDNFEDDYNLIKKLREEFGNIISLRIDSNGKWNVEGAKVFLNRLEEFDIEYAEQPVAGNDEMSELKSFTKIPLAVDESLRTNDDALDIIINGTADVLILKPMMIGGLIPTLQIIDNAKRSGIKCVISSSFESAVGRAFATFAAACIEDDVAHGLSVGEYFEEDIEQFILPIRNGFISLKK
ncbi:MAG: o-succinylbenzoate synthase [Ignavibacteriales bacterium]|nr:MAG: o-succinylbenzoate synthase [Ignavibacteriales bacterium]